jgi:hypothetical protein
MQTPHCEVKALGASPRTFGRPPVPAQRYYSCDHHGDFTHDVERNAYSGGIPEEFQPLLRSYFVQFQLEGTVEIMAGSDEEARRLVGSMAGAEVLDLPVIDEAVSVIEVEEKDADDEDEDTGVLRLVGSDRASDGE